MVMMIVDGVVLWRLNASVIIIIGDFFIRDMQLFAESIIIINYKFFPN